MKNKTTTKTKKGVYNQQDNELPNRKKFMITKPTVNPVYDELVVDGHEDFYSYLDWLGLAKKTDLLILTASHHYYFEIEDLKNVKTVVNLNQLNNMKRLNDFLQAISSVMPVKCHFIGCFTDNKIQNIFVSPKKPVYQIDSDGNNSEIESGPWSSFLNMLYGIIDSKTNRYLTKKAVHAMLEETGLKILDITEFNGLTYFCTQKDKPSVE
jgi:hypothetical protein